MSTTTADSSSGGFTVTAASITSTSVYGLAATVAVPNQFRGKPMIIQGVVGDAGALNGLQYTEFGPTEVAVMSDADFNTPTSIMPQTSYTGSNPPYQTVAAGSFWFKIAIAPPTFAIYAKKSSATTTLAISGTVLG